MPSVPTIRPLPHLLEAAAAAARHVTGPGPENGGERNAEFAAALLRRGPGF